MAGRPAHRRPMAVLAAGALIAIGTPALAATPDPPSAGEVDRSKQAVRDKAREVANIRTRLARANVDLEALGGQVELAMERYNGQVVKLGHARAAYQAAQQRLSAAADNYEKARSDLADFAVEAYRTTNGGIGGLAAVVAGTGGPQGFLDRAGLMQMVAQQQDDLLARVKAAQEVSRILRGQAKKAYDRQEDATEAAETAKTDAIGALDRQKAAVANLNSIKARLVTQLGQAQSRAALLQQQRADALRRQQMAARAKNAVNFAGGRNFSAAGRGAVVVRAALKWLGTKYSWGGGTASGPSYGIEHGSGIRGFDCSGLALYAWAKAGVRLDHWTGTQWTSGPHVPLGALRPGDLVFFATNKNDPDTIHHVGIYIGSGQMVEAPYTGARVRVSTIWRNGLIGATRPA